MAAAAKKDDETKELVNQKTGEITSLADEYAGYAEDIGAGFDGQTSEDIGIPYLALMQQMSPEVTAEGSEVKMGQWVCRGTGEVFKDGVTIIPCLTRHVYREWQSRDPTSSAPVADHEIDSPLIIKVRKDQPFGDYSHPDNPDHPLVEVFDMFCVHLTSDGVGIPAVVSFSSTAIKSYKEFILRARSLLVQLPDGRKINPPLFSTAYTLRSKRVEKKPHAWAVPVVTFADPAGAEKSRILPSSELYAQAKSLREAVLSGQAKAAAPVRTEAGDAPLKRGDTESETAPY